MILTKKERETLEELRIHYRCRTVKEAILRAAREILQS